MQFYNVMILMLINITCNILYTKLTACLSLSNQQIILPHHHNTWNLATAGDLHC